MSSITRYHHNVLGGHEETTTKDGMMGGNYQNDDDDDDLHDVGQQQQLSGAGGIFSLIKSIFMNIYRFIADSFLQNFPLVTTLLTWFFVISIPASLITRWFDQYFAFNMFQDFRFLHIFHFLIPRSVPCSILSAVFTSYYGSRVEEQRGSSFLLCFLLLTLVLTQATSYVLYVLFTKTTWYLFSKSWYQQLGADFLPVGLILLNAFLSNDYYLFVMGLPYRFHVIPTILFITGALGALHLRFPVEIWATVCWVFLLKYLWLSINYTKLTGLALTPFLSQFGPVQIAPVWSYDDKMNSQELSREEERMARQVEAHSHAYIIPLAVTEGFGDITATESTIHSHNVKYQLVNFYKNKRRSKSNYSSTNDSQNNNQNNNTQNSLDQNNIHFSTLHTPNNSQQQNNIRPRQDSESSTSPAEVLMGTQSSSSSSTSSSYNEKTGLLAVDSDDENYVADANQCLTIYDYYNEVNANGAKNICNVTNVVQHLKFRRVVYKLDKKLAMPTSMRYLSIRDSAPGLVMRENNNLSSTTSHQQQSFDDDMFSSPINVNTMRDGNASNRV